MYIFNEAKMKLYQKNIVRDVDNILEFHWLSVSMANLLQMSVCDAQQNRQTFVF